MKKVFLGIAVLAFLVTACNSSNETKEDAKDSVNDAQSIEIISASQPKVEAGRYVNLMSGEEVDIIRDSTIGIAIDRETQMPVMFYYDPVSLDTMYQNGMVVNHLLIKEGEGKYKLDDTKVKIDGDEIKIRSDSSKLKINSGKLKMKSGDDKVKLDHGEMKVKPRI